MRIQFGLIAAALALAGCGDNFDNKTCAGFMAGVWTGDGNMGPAEGSEVESRWEFRSDGSAGGATKYMTAEGRVEKSLEGTWEAEPGHKPENCFVRWSAADKRTSSSWEVRIDDHDTLSSFRGTMKRQK